MAGGGGVVARGGGVVTKERGGVVALQGGKTVCIDGFVSKLIYYSSFTRTIFPTIIRLPSASSARIARQSYDQNSQTDKPAKFRVSQNICSDLCLTKYQSRPYYSIITDK